MKIQSTRLGEIEVDEKDILNIPEGILGFPEYKRYAWVKSIDQDSPIELLQSVDDSNLTFILTDPFLFKVDYAFDLQEEWKSKLDIQLLKQVSVRAIVTARSNNQTSMNLKAPLIINMESYNSAQIILDRPEYALQYFIGEEEQHASTNEV